MKIGMYEPTEPDGGQADPEDVPLSGGVAPESPWDLLESKIRSTGGYRFAVGSCEEGLRAACCGTGRS
jgi:hypothetical protein